MAALRRTVMRALSAMGPPGRPFPRAGRAHIPRRRHMLAWRWIAMRQCCGRGCGRMCLPLCIVPRAAPGRVRAYCCGRPKLVRANDPGADCGGCRYILRQPMMAEIPVEIGAAAFAGTPFLQFNPQCNCWKWEEE